MTIEATQAGNANWNAAAPVNRTFSVGAKTVTPSFTAGNKTYDGTTSATIATRSLSGVINSDPVSLDGGTATFANAGVVLADAANVRLASVTTSTNGAAIRTNATYVLYTVPPGGNVTDLFSYSVTDGTATAAGEVRITIQASPTGLTANLATYGLVNGIPTVTFVGVPGYAYLIQRTTSLAGTPVWTTLSSTNAPANGSFLYADEAAPGGSVFYRAINE